MMNIKSLFIVLAAAAVVVTAGLMTTSQAHDQRDNRQDNRGYRDRRDYRDERGWLGVKKTPDERRGFFSNLVGIPQDVGEGTIGALTGGASRRDSRRRYIRQQREQEQQEQQPGRPMER